MSEPFSLSKSEDLVKARFTESFHHARHYRCLINGVLKVAQSQFENKPWAILIDWGTSFIQIPEEEKLCMRFLHEYYQKGMKYLVNVTPSHPIVEWQMQKISKANPEVDMFTTDSFEAAEAWLTDKHINVSTVSVDIASNWYKKSNEFSRMINKYGVDKEKFDGA